MEVKKIGKCYYLYRSTAVWHSIEKKRNGVELFPIQKEYGRLSPQHATGHHVE